MQAIFYFNKSDPNHITKSLNELGSSNIELKEQTSIIDPVLRMSGSYDWISTCNYVYVPTLKRYYFIKEVQSISNGLWEIQCHCDVLMSYKDYILQQEGVVSRQEFNYNLLLDDGSLLSYADPTIQTKLFPTSFNDSGGQIIIVGAGR